MTVIVPVLVPRAAVVVSTVTVTVPLFEPLAGLTVSQLTASETLQAEFDVIDSDWAAGFAAPCVALNVMLVEPTVNDGAGGLTVNETGMVCGELVAPVPVIVIDVLYVPAASPVTFAATPREPPPDPDAGETVSHDAALEAFQLSEPVPVLLMATVCAEGFTPP